MEKRDGERARCLRACTAHTHTRARIRAHAPARASTRRAFPQREFHLAYCVGVPMTQKLHTVQFLEQDLRSSASPASSRRSFYRSEAGGHGHGLLPRRHPRTLALRGCARLLSSSSGAAGGVHASPLPPCCGLLLMIKIIPSLRPWPPVWRWTGRPLLRGQSYEAQICCFAMRPTARTHADRSHLRPPRPRGGA